MVKHVLKMENVIHALKVCSVTNVIRFVLWVILLVMLKETLQDVRADFVVWMQAVLLDVKLDVWEDVMRKLVPVEKLKIHFYLLLERSDLMGIIVNLLYQCITNLIDCKFILANKDHNGPKTYKNAS